MIAIDGLAISRRQGLGRIVNSALLGGFARALQAPSLEQMKRTLMENSPKLIEANIAACEDGYQRADELLREVAA